MADQPNEQFLIEVNGIEIKVNYEKLVAADVLKLAAEHNAIKGNPDEFILESNDPEHEFKNDDWVNFHEYKDFIAEKSAPTPIAGACENE